MCVMLATLNLLMQMFSWILLISNSMVSRAFEKNSIVSFSKTSNCTRPLDSCNIYSVIVFDFEKRTRACFFQAALETVLLIIETF
jgi:hypothetical protein